MILLVGSNKGGSGKTTVACNLAAALALRGADICLIDADRQGSAARWGAEREAADIDPAINIVQKYDNISKTVRAMKEKFSHVIVDVAGRNSREMITAAAVADVLLAPSQCSQLDMDTLEELDTQIEQIHDTNPKLKVFIYQTMSSTNPKVTNKEREDFITYVSEYETMKPLQAIGYYRKVYRDVFSEGLSVLEADNRSAEKEILDLFEEVFPEW